MNELIVKLRILARAEITLFKAEATRRANKAILAAMSLGCVFVGLIFINIGAFFTLTESTIDARAAWILAAANIGLGLIPFLLQRQDKMSSEEAMVREIRDMASEELSRDVGSVVDEIDAVVDSVKQVKTSIDSFTSASASSPLGAIAPLLPMVIDLLKGGKK